MRLLATISWLTLALYVGLMIGLSRHYSPKILADQILPSGVPADIDSIYATVGGRMYLAFAPLWAQNRYVLTGWLFVAILLTVLAVRPLGERPRANNA